MLKSLLIGLDGSDDSRPVLELGLRWAKRFDALAVGIAVVDEPGILTSEAVLFAGGHHWHTADAAAPRLSHSRHRVEQMLEQFVRRCGEAGVTCRTLEDVGSPYVQILMEAQCFDLVLLGQETHFDYGHEGKPDETLGKVLQGQPPPGGRGAEGARRGRVGRRRLRRQPPGVPHPLRVRVVGPGLLAEGPCRERCPRHEGRGRDRRPGGRVPAAPRDRGHLRAGGHLRRRRPR